MTHTKGKWEITRHENNKPKGVLARGTGYMCFFPTLSREIDQFFEDENEANAKLIASAPELLEACQMSQGAIMVLLAMGGQSPKEQKENEMVKHLDELIKKAEG